MSKSFFKHLFNMDLVVGVAKAENHYIAFTCLTITQQNICCLCNMNDIINHLMSFNNKTLRIYKHLIVRQCNITRSSQQLLPTRPKTNKTNKFCLFLCYSKRRMLNAINHNVLNGGNNMDMPSQHKRCKVPIINFRCQQLLCTEVLNKFIICILCMLIKLLPEVHSYLIII